MRKYKLIATDLDWTLVYDREKINLDNLEYIKKFLKDGYYFVIITGRPLFMCLPLMHKFGLDTFNNLSLICYNGMVYYSYKDKKSINIADKIKPEDIQKLYEYTKANKLNLLQYIDDLVYVNEVFDYKSKAHSLDLLPLNIDSNFTKNNNKELFKAIIASDNEVLVKHLPILKQKFKNLDFYFSQEFYLEVMPLNINKGSALDFLHKHFNISYDEMIVLGDSENDAYMFEKVKTSFAMEISSPFIKQKANGVLKSAQDDNFKYIIQEYFNIN